MHLNFRRAAALLLTGALGAVATSAYAQAAQEFPIKPIRIVVPYQPGGTNDVVARLVSKNMSEQLGQPVVVENRAGASGNIGAEQISRAEPDGYSLLLVTMGHSIHPSLYQLRYDIQKDLLPVAKLSSGPVLVMVNPKVAANTLQELIALAKQKPGEINYASAGNGSSTHLATELLSAKAGIQLNHIPYGGSAPAMADVVGGNADMVMDLMFSALPQVQGHRLKALAITGAKRSPILPEVPTLAEAGIDDLQIEVWNGLMAPAGTPKAVIDQLNAALKTALSDPHIKERLEAQGFAADWSTPEDFGALIAADVQRWGQVVKETGIRLE